MTFYARLISLLPFTVNVSGRKHDLICTLGKLTTGKPKDFQLNQQKLSLSNHPVAKIYYYAPSNFQKDFEKSALGVLLLSSLKPNDVFVDVGANLGGYSMLAKKKGATVFAFEPFPELYAFLKSNENHFGKVHSYALSNIIGETTFYISDKNIGGSSLVESNLPREASGYTREVSVKVSTGDEVLKDLNKIDWLKIDVEGNEEAVVEGFENMLQKSKIENIWCEVRGPQSDRNPNSYLGVCRRMKAAGYNCYILHIDRMIPFDFEKSQSVPQYFDLWFKMD